MTTHYVFDERWDDLELVDQALDPPFDMEATDWKALAKQLASRLETLHESLNRF